MNLIKIDSRTSDAIALALRYDCPIYTTAEIIAKAGILVNHEDVTVKEEMPSAPLMEAEEIARDYSVQELTRLLDEAVQNEEYEKASKFRDMLKERGKS